MARFSFKNLKKFRIRLFRKLNKRILGKLLEYLAHCATLCELAFYVYEVWEKFSVVPDIGVREHFMFSKKIPFPAVTICSPLVLRSDLVNLKAYKEFVGSNEFGPNLSVTEQNFLPIKAAICAQMLYEKVARDTRNRTEFDLVKFLEKGSPSIDETFSKCQL